MPTPPITAPFTLELDAPALAVDLDSVAAGQGALTAKLVGLQAGDSLQQMAFTAAPAAGGAPVVTKTIDFVARADGQLTAVSLNALQAKAAFSFQPADLDAIRAAGPCVYAVRAWVLRAGVTVYHDVMAGRITAAANPTTVTALLRVASVTITGNPSGAPGGTSQLTATVRDSQGNVVALAVTWTSSNPMVASVDANGLVSQIAPGTAAITATCQGIASLVMATVTDPGFTNPANGAAPVFRTLTGKWAPEILAPDALTDIIAANESGASNLLAMYDATANVLRRVGLARLAGIIFRLFGIYVVTDPKYGGDPTGALDSTAAWQAAITAAAAAGNGNGAKVLGPPGAYKLTASPFQNQIGTGNITVTVELLGAKWVTARQIRIPNSSQVRGNNRLRCGVFADATSFVPKATISSVARASSIVTVTTTAAHGLDVGATALVAGIATTSFNGAWTVLSVPSPTTFTFAQSVADAADVGGGTLYNPLVVLGDATQFSHGVRADNLCVDLASLTGSVGVFSNTINELSGGDHLLIQNFGYRGLWVEQDANSYAQTGAIPNNYMFRDLEVYPLGAQSPLATGVYLRAASSGQHRGLDGVTVVPATNPGSNTLAAGIDASGVAGHYSRLHFEGTADGLLIGARGGSDANAASGGSSAGIVASGVTGNGTVGNCVRLVNAAEVHDVVVLAVAARGAAAAIKNDISGVTIAQNYVGFYSYGNVSGPTEFTSDPSTSWRINNNLRVRGQTFLGASGAGLSGALYGSVTLSAAATTTKADTNVTASSRIMLFPTNAAAATLQATKGVCVSTRVVGTSFTVATGDGSAAAGTETFDYVGFN